MIYTTKIEKLLDFPIKKIKYRDISDVSLTKNIGENKYETVEEVIEDVKKKVYHGEIYGRVISNDKEGIIVLTHGDAKGIDLTLTYIPACCVIEIKNLESE